jgi:hypothetical protein
MINPISGQPAMQARTDSAAVVSLVLGFISLGGLVFPPMLATAIIGIVLGWTARRRIAASQGMLKGGWVAIAGLVLSVLGALCSLVFPAFVVSVWIYAAFHGGQLPYGA